MDSEGSDSDDKFFDSDEYKEDITCDSDASAHESNPDTGKNLKKRVSSEDSENVSTSPKRARRQDPESPERQLEDDLDDTPKDVEGEQSRCFSL